MHCIGNYHKLLIICIKTILDHIFISILTEITRMCLFAVKHQYGTAYFITVLQNRHIHKGHTAGNIPAIIGEVDNSRYECITLPPKDTWGVLMRKDSKLADREYILPEDLYNKPIIVSRQAHRKKEFAALFGNHYNKLNIVATHNLIYNASLMVDEGFGYAITFDKIINTENTNLKFIPFKPAITADMHFIWKKQQIFSKASEKFLNTLLAENNSLI